MIGNIFKNFLTETQTYFFFFIFGKICSQSTQVNIPIEIL